MSVAIAQTTYATNTGSKTNALRQLLEAIELEGVLVQARICMQIALFPLLRPARCRLLNRG